MRLLLAALLSTVALSSTAFAGLCADSKGKDISQDPEIFQAEIQKQSSCSAASELAQACSWGSSLDVSTAGVAAEVCEKQLKANKPAKADLQLLQTMVNRCNGKYEKEEGTMYRSFNAYCNLTALEWIVNLTTLN